MTQKVVSFQIADSIDLKQFVAVFKADLAYNDPAELLYRMDTDQYIYVFKYGCLLLVIIQCY